MPFGGNTEPPIKKKLDYPNANWICTKCFDDRPGYMTNCPDCYSPRPY